MVNARVAPSTVYTRKQKVTTDGHYTTTEYI